MCTSIGLPNRSATCVRWTCSSRKVDFRALQEDYDLRCRCRHSPRRRLGKRLHILVHTKPAHSAGVRQLIFSPHRTTVGDQFATNFLKNPSTRTNTLQREFQAIQQFRLMAKDLQRRGFLPLKLVRLPVPPRPPCGFPILNGAEFVCQMGTDSRNNPLADRVSLCFPVGNVRKSVLEIRLRLDMMRLACGERVSLWRRFFCAGRVFASTFLRVGIGGGRDAKFGPRVVSNRGTAFREARSSKLQISNGSVNFVGHLGQQSTKQRSGSLHSVASVRVARAIQRGVRLRLE
jgi:hypothetical protein